MERKGVGRREKERSGEVLLLPVFVAGSNKKGLTMLR